MALGLDAREFTPGLKRYMTVLNAETQSFKRAAVALKLLTGLEVSDNTIERVTLEIGGELSDAEQSGWDSVLQGEVVPPELAFVSFDGGRIRTRKMNAGSGVHVEGTGWSETKNAIFVSATSQVSDVDPHPLPPACFLNRNSVGQLAATIKLKENQGETSSTDEGDEQAAASIVDELLGQGRRGKNNANNAHKPKRILRTVVASMKNSREFGKQMEREANRRRFGEANRKAYVADGLACNWTIHAEHFSDYTAVLDFTHAVTHLHSAAVACVGKTDEAWDLYQQWMTLVWQGRTVEVITGLRRHQSRLGDPPEGAANDDPREVVRKEIGYLENNVSRMRYDEFRKQGLPTSSAWMESAVKEMNHRVKATDKFWNNPNGAEAIVQVRAAALCDDNRLFRILTKRPGKPTIRNNKHTIQTS